MFFDNLSDISKIAAKISCSIFAVPPSTKLNLKNALTLEPSDDKKTLLISVEQLRDFLSLTNNIETTERYFIIRPADAMNEAAQNAFLKTFEEPKSHCHFILLTEQPSALLSTILSRAQVFYPRQTGILDTPPAAKDKILTQAKRLIATQPIDLPAIAADFTKSKTQPRQQTLEIISAAIELLYKSYFKTGNAKFLTKLPNFIQLYDNIANNGHIKLHLVADLC